MDYESFKKLSLAPLSYDSLSLAFAALRVIQRRYPNVPVTDSNYSVYPSTANSIIYENPRLSNIPNDWGVYAEVFECIKDTAREHLLYSVMEDKPVLPTIVDEYLNLLRHKSLGINILDARIIKEGICYIQDEGLDRPTIIPLQILGYRNAWAFIVAYSDCIHYYDSGDNSLKLTVIDNTSRAVETDWTGPKNENENLSGIYMLLGIRRIIEGHPHISQQAATGKALESFRIRILIELHCKKTDPSLEEFQPSQAGNIYNPPATSFWGSQNISVPRESAPLMPIDGSAPIVHSGLQNMLSTRESIPVILGDDSNMAPNFISENMFLSTGQGSVESLSNSTPELSHSSVTRRSTPATSPGSRLSPQPTSQLSNNAKAFNTMKGILNLLSTASLACRLSKVSKNTSLAILWHAVKEDHFGSKFHQRYNAVLFYNKMEALRSDDAIKSEIKGGDIRMMKTRKKQCKFWKDVYDIGESFGWEDDDRYVLLLAISSLSANESQQNKEDILEQLRRRLNNDSDPLKQWLLSAKELCAAIIKQSLPEENLMIDVYFLKKGEEIDQRTYDSFVSIDPHNAIMIDRV